MKLKSQRLFTLLKVILAAAVIASALMVVRDAVFFAGIKKTKEPSQREDALSAKERGAVAPRDLMVYAPILENNIFGFPAGTFSDLSGGAGGAEATAAPVARVDLLLVGVVAWPKGVGYAVLADPATGRQEVYKTGDNIPGYGTLRRVLADRAYIDLRGREVEVALAEIATLKEISKPGPPGLSGAFVRKTAEGSYVIDQKALQSALAKPDQIMTDARLLPAIVEGKQEGFTIRDVKRGGLYESLGLKNGDVLIRVNDFNISDPETALQAFTALKGMDRVELDIKRDGSRMSLTYSIR